MPRVIVMFMSGPDDGALLELDSEQGHGTACEGGWEYIVGRRDTCDLKILYDTQVSREHAFLRVLDDGIWIDDAGSRNGCIVRGQRITGPTRLESGEVFQVGRTWLRIQEMDQ